MKKFLGVCCIVLLALMSLSLAGMAWMVGTDAVEQRRWTRIEATAKGYTLTFHKHCGKGSCYCADVTLSYTANMQPHETPISQCYPGTWQHSFVEHLVQEKFAQGSSVAIFYNPSNPAKARRKRAGFGVAFYMMLILASLTGGAVGILLHALITKKPSPPKVGSKLPPSVE